MSLQWQNDEDKMRCQNVYRNDHDTMCGAGCAQFHYYRTIRIYKIRIHMQKRLSANLGDLFCE